MSSTWQCPVCGTSNSVDIGRCPRCGRVALSPQEIAAARATHSRRSIWGQFFMGIGLGVLLMYVLPLSVIVVASRRSPGGRVPATVGDTTFAVMGIAVLGSLAYLLAKRRWEATAGLLLGALGMALFVVAGITTG